MLRYPKCMTVILMSITADFNESNKLVNRAGEAFSRLLVNFFSKKKGLQWRLVIGKS